MASLSVSMIILSKVEEPIIGQMNESLKKNHSYFEPLHYEVVCYEVIDN